MKKNNEKIDVLLVSYHIPSNGIPLMIIGRKDGSEMTNIVNAFSGNEALEIYDRLTTSLLRKGDKNEI